MFYDYPFNPYHVAGFDLETTGPDPFTARIVTAAVTLLDDTQGTSLGWLANPGCVIPDGAVAVHGITTEHAHAYGDPHDDVVRGVCDALYDAWAQGRTVVVYNAAYDLTMLTMLNPEFSIRGPVIDPMVLCPMLIPNARVMKLPVIAQRLGVPLNNAHAADADAVAACGVAEAFARQYPHLTQCSARVLLQNQWAQKHGWYSTLGWRKDPPVSREIIRERWSAGQW